MNRLVIFLLFALVTMPLSSKGVADAVIGFVSELIQEAAVDAAKLYFGSAPATKHDLNELEEKMAKMQKGIERLQSYPEIDPRVIKDALSKQRQLKQMVYTLHNRLKNLEYQVLDHEQRIIHLEDGYQPNYPIPNSAQSIDQLLLSRGGYATPINENKVLSYMNQMQIPSVCRARSYAIIHVDSDSPNKFTIKAIYSYGIKKDKNYAVSYFNESGVEGEFTVTFFGRPYRDVKFWLGEYQLSEDNERIWSPYRNPGWYLACGIKSIYHKLPSKKSKASSDELGLSFLEHIGSNKANPADAPKARAAD